MDMGQKQTGHKTTSQINNFAQVSAPAVQRQAPTAVKKVSRVKEIPQKKFAVNKLAKKNFKVKKIKSKSFGKGDDETVDIGEYSDADWDSYTEYQDIEVSESLNVNAKIKKRN